MAFKYLILLISSIAFGQNTLRTTDFQQSLNANAPRNYILNSGAEKNLLNTSGTGVTITRSTSSPLEGAASFSVDFTGVGRAFFTGTAFQIGIHGQSCEARFVYSSDATGVLAYVELNGFRVSDRVSLLNAGSTSQMVSIIFPCGSSTSDVPNIVLDAGADLPAFKVDSLYIGRALSLGTVAQAQVIVSAKRITSAQSVAVATPVQVVMNSEEVDLFNEFNTSTGTFTAASPKVVAISGSLQLANYTADQSAFILAYKNGSEVCRFFLEGANSTAPAIALPACRVSLATNDTLAIYVDSNGDAAYDVSVSEATKLMIVSYPSSAETILRSNATNVAVEATGTPTGSLAGANATIWGTETRDTTGSYNATTGEFTAPNVGDYCWAASVQVSHSSAANNTRVKLEPYVNGTILSRGGGVYKFSNPSGTTPAIQVSSVSCTFLNRSDVLTFRTDSNATGAAFSASDATMNTLVIQNASAGLPKPYIPGSEFNQYTGTTNAVYAEINCDASSSITSQSGGLSTVGNRSTTSCALTIAAGVFSLTPWYCGMTVKSSTVQATSCSCSSATSCAVYGPSADYDGYIQLKGAR